MAPILKSNQETTVTRSDCNRGAQAGSLQRMVSTPTPLRGEQWEKELAPILGWRRHFHGRRK
jgi:hypothetical protein